MGGHTLIRASGLTTSILRIRSLAAASMLDGIVNVPMRIFLRSEEKASTELQPPQNHVPLTSSWLGSSRRRRGAFLL